MTPAIASFGGWWWPLDDIHARPVIERDCIPSIMALLAHVPGRDCIVQAGANCGVYPVMLADHFRSVVTCEPDPTNWLCLVKNIAARDCHKRVMAFDAAFGEEPGVCTPLVVEPHNCGAHRVNFAKGPIPVITVDSLNLEACDAIWGDVEGAELPMLKGAAQTIERFSPVLCLEDKGLHRAFEIPDGALQAWLAERGYSQVDRIGQDRVFQRIT